MWKLWKILEMMQSACDVSVFCSNLWNYIFVDVSQTQQRISLNCCHCIWLRNNSIQWWPKYVHQKSIFTFVNFFLDSSILKAISPKIASVPTNGRPAASICTLLKVNGISGELSYRTVCSEPNSVWVALCLSIKFYCTFALDTLCARKCQWKLNKLQDFRSHRKVMYAELTKVVHTDADPVPAKPLCRRCRILANFEAGRVDP